MSETELKAKAWDLANDADINRAAVDGFPYPVLFVNSEGQIVRANEQACSFFSYHATELVGKLVEVLIPVEYRERHAQHLKRYFNDPRERPMGLNLDIKTLRRDGSTLNVELFLKPVSAVGGTLAMAVVQLKRTVEVNV